MSTSTPEVQTQVFYISSGSKNAMYTLRYVRHGNQFSVDNYVCNLSTDAEKAEAKAQEYFDRFKARVGESQYFKLVFNGFADFELNSRASTFSVEQTNMLEELQRGVMPMGKHVGKKISELPESTVLWYADQVSVDIEDANGNEYSRRKVAFFQAVCSFMLGYALEREYIAKREARKEELAAEMALSNYIGNKGERLVFEGKLVAVKNLGMTQVSYNSWISRYCNIVKCGTDIVVYFGSTTLGEVCEEVRFKATVKDHVERHGNKSTIVNRPSRY